MAGFGINADDLGIETQIDACLVVEAVRTQRQPILWCLTGKVILGQNRSINRCSGVTAQHDDTAAKLPPPQHLRRGEAGRATPNNNYGSSGNRVDESNGKCGLKPHGYWVFEVS